MNSFDNLSGQFSTNNINWSENSLALSLNSAIKLHNDGPLILRDLCLKNNNNNNNNNNRHTMGLYYIAHAWAEMEDRDE